MSTPKFQPTYGGDEDSQSLPQHTRDPFDAWMRVQIGVHRTHDLREKGPKFTEQRAKEAVECRRYEITA